MDSFTARCGGVFTFEMYRSFQFCLVLHRNSFRVLLESLIETLVGTGSVKKNLSLVHSISFGLRPATEIGSQFIEQRNPSS